MSWVAGVLVAEKPVITCARDPPPTAKPENSARSGVKVNMASGAAGLSVKEPGAIVPPPRNVPTVAVVGPLSVPLAPTVNGSEATPTGPREGPSTQYVVALQMPILTPHRFADQGSSHLDHWGRGGQHATQRPLRGARLKTAICDSSPRVFSGFACQHLPTNSRAPSLFPSPSRCSAAAWSVALQQSTAGRTLPMQVARLHFSKSSRRGSPLPPRPSTGAHQTVLWQSQGAPLSTRLRSGLRRLPFSCASWAQAFRTMM